MRDNRWWKVAWGVLVVGATILLSAAGRAPSSLSAAVSPSVSAAAGDAGTIFHRGSPTGHAAIGGGTTSNQGPQLHGTGVIFEPVHFSLKQMPPGLSWLSVKGETVLQVQKGTRPVLLSKDSMYTFRIESVGAHSNAYGATTANPATVEYRVSYGTGTSEARYQESGKLCEGRGALLVRGRWGDDGSYWPDDPSFSFACLPRKASPPGSPAAVFLEGGAIAKCIDWGYPPWASDPNSVQHAQLLHVACTRMAMADYCGENRPNTIEGTPIWFYEKDVDPPPSGVPPDSSWALESAWMAEPVPACEDGCSPDAGSRHYRGRAACLSKQRWKTFPFNGLCPRKLPDPRAVPEGGESRYCENLDARSAVQMLVVYSKFLDSGLYRLSLPNGSIATTTQVDFVSGHVNFQNMQLPLASATFEGTVFSQQNAPWDQLGLPGAHSLGPLMMCQDGGGHYRTALGCLSKDVFKSVQGYVFTSAPPIDNAALFIGQGPNGQSVTTTNQRIFAPSVPEGPIGYLPRFRPSP